MDKKKLLWIQDFITPTASKESKNDCGPLKAELCLYEDFTGAFKGRRFVSRRRSSAKLRIAFKSANKIFDFRGEEDFTGDARRFDRRRLTNLRFVRRSGDNKALLSQHNQTPVKHTNPRLCFANRRFINLRLCTVQNIFWYSTDKTSYTIVRPLIACLRSRVTMTCLASLLPVYPDLSNLKIRYSRNRIRRQILPAVKFFLNPKAEKALFQFSEFYNKASKKA